MGLHYASCVLCFFCFFLALRNLLEALELSVEQISKSTDPEGPWGCEALKAYRLKVLVEKLENLTDRRIREFLFCSTTSRYELQ